MTYLSLPADQGGITLSDNNNNFIAGPGSTAPVTFNNSVTMSSAGSVGGGNLILNNQKNGLIDATGSNPLIIDTGANTVLNSGTLHARVLPPRNQSRRSRLIWTLHVIGA